MAALVGDVSGVVAYGLEGARTLGSLQMSRTAESEADRDGIRLLQEAGIDTAGMITFFEKLLARERRGGDIVPRYLRTHPTTTERIATLRALAAAGARPSGRLLPDDEWDGVKNLCGELPADARSPRR
jgi:beta-barrel assembly-enhancing protease